MYHHPHSVLPNITIRSYSLNCVVIYYHGYSPYPVLLYSMDVVLSVFIIANNACIINLLTGKSYELAEVK